MAFVDVSEPTTLTITLASLASGSARQGAEVDNPLNRPQARIGVQVTTGTSPTASTTIEIYLLRKTFGIYDDNAGTGDAAITIDQAPLLGTIVVDATSDKTYYRTFTTEAMGDLSSKFVIAVKNNTGAALNATAGNHSIEVELLRASTQA